MSTPQSRLADFLSYSYYHVLVMCDSTATADALSKSSDLDVWNHATSASAAPGDGADESLGIYSPKTIDGAGRYIVLINGSTDAAYVIQSAQWASTTAGDAVPGNRSTSIALEGSISISEPKGIAFLDQVVKCSIALGVDSSQVVYLLKTVFVGHKASDAEEPEVLTLNDIPPVMFLTYDVTGDFTEAGGSYEMMFVGISHGATRLPQYSKMANSFTLKAGDDLESTLKRLEANVNESYDKYYQCVYDQINLMDIDSKDQILKSLRKVKYVIVADGVYSAANGGSKYKVTDQPYQYKNQASCDEVAQLNFPQHTSIETAISIIMGMCPEVRKDMTEGDPNGIKYEYKIHTTYVSTPGTGDNSELIDYTVYYRVSRFMTPKTLATHPVFETLAADDPTTSDDFAAIRNNILEFDYIYTGNNTDVLEFDMKLNTGLAYLQIATMVNAFSTSNKRQPYVGKHISDTDKQTFVNRWDSDHPMQIPILFGSQVKLPTMGTTNDPNSTTQTLYTMAKHASIEVSEATMKIFGNDLLLGSTNRTSSPDYVMNEGTTTISKSSDLPVAADFQCWTHAPAYAKVNIKMPRMNDDVAVYTGADSSGEELGLNYAVDFWFDGYYYVYGIQHSFIDGEFTQTLQMLGIPKRSTFDSVNKKSATQDVTTLAASCFDSPVTCADSTATPTGGNSKQVAAPPPTESRDSTTAAPTNREDAKTVSADPQGLSNVKGWDGASPAVKEAIKNAAASYGVDVVTLARIAYHESKFKAGAKAPPTASTATGLFQFVGGTWIDLKNADKIKGLPRSTSNASALAKRTDPQLNANAGAAYTKDNMSKVGSDVGDIYMAHFIGPGGARKIIAADERSGGRALLSDVLGTRGFRDARNANKNVITRSDFTVGELRDWAAKAMADTLKNGNATISRKRSTLPAKDTPAKTAPPTTNPSNVRANEAVSASVNCDTDKKKEVQECNAAAKQKTDAPSSTTQR